MTGTNGVDIQNSAHQNGGNVVARKERTAKEAELLKQVREKIAVLDPQSQVSSRLGGSSWLKKVYIEFGFYLNARSTVHSS